MRITFRTGDGKSEVVETESGNTVMEAARFACIPGIEGLCGGTIACGTCHVHLLDGWYDRIGGPGESEEDLLDSLDDRCPTSRLGCQITISDDLDGLVVKVATS